MSQERGLSVSQKAALWGGAAALGVTGGVGLGLYVVDHVAETSEQRIEWDLAHGGLSEWANSGRLTVEIDRSVSNLLADNVQIDAVIRDLGGCDIRIQDWDSMVDQGAHVTIPIALTEIETLDGDTSWRLIELLDSGKSSEGDILVRRGEPLNKGAVTQLIAPFCEFDGQTLFNTARV